MFQESIDRKQAIAILKFETPRYLFRRFNILREIRSGNNFVEIGAGNMRLTCELARRFDRGIAIEYSTQTVKLFECLRSTHFPNISLHHETFQNAHITTTFDLVIACEVLERIEDDRAFLQKMLRLVKPGGQLIFSVPAQMKFWADSDENVGHYRRYEKSNIDALMKQYDLTNYKILSYGYPFINGFRLLREIKAKREKKLKSAWTKMQQTAESGFPEIPGHYFVSRYLVNRYTMWPFALFSTLFNRFDFSEGYIVVIDNM